MSKAPKSQRPGKTGFVLGRQAFARISAVEGVRLSPRMEERFADFDRKGLSPSERRSAIVRDLVKKR